MFESAENALQILLLAGCIPAAILRAIAGRSKALALLSLFYGSWVLGDCYWLSCLVFFDSTPEISVVSDLSWYASYLFLYLLLRQVAPAGRRRPAKSPLPWAGPVFAAAMACFFMRWGEIISNLIYAVLMAILLYEALRLLSEHGSDRGPVYLCVTILTFCALEYGMWTASCYFKDASLWNPYTWLDFLLTLSFPFFIPATVRAQTAGTSA